MSMKIATAEKVMPDAQRDAKYDWYLAKIESTEEPTSGEVTGADVDGCSANVRFAAGSVIAFPSGRWEAFSDGEFSAQ